MRCLGNIELTVDGERIQPNKTMVYRGAMASGVPNMAFAIGYTNASWTLKCDLTSRFVCRLLNHMDAHGFDRACPRRDPAVAELPLIGFSSGYVRRAIDRFPRQGSTTPWKLHQNYARDVRLLQRGSVDDGVMEFSNPAVPLARPEPAGGMVAAG